MSEKNMHDGALLQIVRHHKPDLIYLYMTEEILKNHEKDNRYLYSLDKLGEHIQHTFEIKIIERRNLKKVQLFDPIYTDIRGLLDEILKGVRQEDELLLNISSGTPSMKSALLVLATMIDIPCTCYQVDTPEGKMNEHEHSDFYDTETYWELNPDNTYQPGDKNYNRTHAEQLISLKKLKYEEIIKTCVLKYDYQTALTVAEEMSSQETKGYIHKLRIANARKQMNFPEVDRFLKEVNPEIYSPIKEVDARRSYEYTLSLQSKVESQEYADVLRSISPILVKLFEEILLKQTGLDLKDYSYKINGILYWDTDKLKKNPACSNILNKRYGSGFEGGWIKSDHLAALIQGMVKEKSVRRCVDDLREIEKRVRNLAAHNMISVSDDWIKKETGYTSKEIICIVRKAFLYTSYNIPVRLWDSYDRMNEDIISSI